MDNPEVKPRRDNETFFKTLMTSQSMEPFRSRLADIPTVGYGGARSLYRKQIAEINAGPHGYFNVNPIRHKLKDGTLEDVVQEAPLADGYKTKLMQGEVREGLSLGGERCAHSSGGVHGAPERSEGAGLLREVVPGLHCAEPADRGSDELNK